MPRYWRRMPYMATWLTVVVLAGCAARVQAQTPTTGALVGTVHSAAGAIQRDAIVTLRDTVSGMDRMVLTSRRGEFAFPFLAPGEYELSVETIGFAPQRFVGISVRPGHALEVAVTLESGGAAPARVQRIEYGTLQSMRPGSSQWLPEFGIADLPASQRTMGELMRLASSADDANTVEGLPVSLSTLVIDGIVFRPAAGSPQLDGRRWTSGFALSSVQSGQLVTNGVDVEWGDAAGAILSVHTRRGAAKTHVDGAGYWSGNVLPGGSSFDSDTQSFNDVQGGFVLRAPLLTDSARFTLGVEARQLETPLSSAWADTPGAAALAGHGVGSGLALDVYRQPGVARQRSVAGFGRLDWSVAGRHQLEVSTQFMTVPGSTSLLPGSVPQFEGSDVVLGSALRSSFGTGGNNELRVALTTTRRELPGADSTPFTAVAAEALRFGDESPLYSAQETLIRVSDALHYRAGSHALKVGAGFTFGSYRYDNQPGARGSYFFGDVDQLIAGSGVFSRIEGPAAFADWSNHTISVFAQDRWSAGGGLDVTIGVRAERETLPQNVRRDEQWFQLTGLSNDDAGSASWRIAPRVGMTWDVRQANTWIMHASGGVYFDRSDPLLLAQWQTDDGTNEVRRVVGSLAWPDIGPAAGVTAPRLTMLGPGFDAPETARLSAGMSRRLGRTTLQLGGVFRRTENLPRRSDLNLLPLPAFRDQHGRAVFGTLVKNGSLLAADPGTGRRFTEYDEVAALSADGWSDHWGVTAGIDRELTDALAVIARYTWGRTTDNWVGAAQGGWHLAAPAGLDGDWSEGSSDFDRPHRAVVGAVMTVVPVVRVAALYRLQSGLPFTPGFRPGVDANADDVAGNDPAFIDAAVPGMDAVMRRWPCLRESAGRFAERNSCRTEATHGLDLGLNVRVARLGSASTALVADVFDVLESAERAPDAALYLVDPVANLVTDAGARTVAVPLLVNPEFGEPLASRHSGRRIRLGISLTW